MQNLVCTVKYFLLHDTFKISRFRYKMYFISPPLFLHAVTKRRRLNTFKYLVISIMYVKFRDVCEFPLLKRPGFKASQVIDAYVLYRKFAKTLCLKKLCVDPKVEAGQQYELNIKILCYEFGLSM